MEKTRYNWPAIIGAVAYLTDEPATNGLEGNGFAISRTTENKLSIVVTEGEYDVSTQPEVLEETPKDVSEITPESPTASPNISNGTPESPSPTPSVSVDASESAPTPAPTQDAPAPVTTGQGEAETSAVPTGQ